MRVSYSGYYASLPRTRHGFDSRYPLHQKIPLSKRDFLIQLNYENKM